MQDTKEYELAKKDVLKWLSYRARSESELTNRLAKKGYSKESIDKVMDFLKEYKLVNDQNFAELWVENKMLGKPVGRMKIIFELRQYGIKEEIIELALEKMDGEMEFNLAKGLVKKTIENSLKPISWQRLARLLQSRGFSYETIIKVNSYYNML